MSGTVAPASADAAPVRLAAVDSTVISWLQANAVDGRMQASQTFIGEEIGRNAGSVGTSTRKLESAGLLTIIRSAVRSVPNVYVLADSYSVGVSRRVAPFESLPDCFRTRDLNSAGQLWQAAEKGKEYRPRELLELAPVASLSGLNAILNKLEALAVPAVTSRANPRHRIGRLYKFHDLAENERAVILADLQTRVSSRPTTRAQAEAKHEEQRAELRERFGEAAYADLLPAMMDLVTFNEYNCWMWGGEIDGDRYAIVDGVKSLAVRGHRITYHVLIGPIPPGRHLHHYYCGQPSCINPRHVAPVTPEEHREITQAEKWIRTGTVEVPAPAALEGQGEGLAGYASAERARAQ